MSVFARYSLFIALILSSFCQAELPDGVRNSLLNPFIEELQAELNRKTQEMGLGKNGDALLKLRDAENARKATEEKFRELERSLAAAGLQPNPDEAKGKNAELRKLIARTESLTTKRDETAAALAEFEGGHQGLTLPPVDDPNFTLLEQIADLKNQRPSENKDRDAQLAALTEKLTLPKNRTALIRLATLRRREPKRQQELMEVERKAKEAATLVNYYETEAQLKKETETVAKFSKKATLPPPGSPEEAHINELLKLKEAQDGLIAKEEKRLGEKLKLTPPTSEAEIESTANTLANLLKEQAALVGKEDSTGRLLQLETEISNTYEKLELQIARVQPRALDHLMGVKAQDLTNGFLSFAGMIGMGALLAANREQIPSVAEAIMKYKTQIMSLAGPYLGSLAWRFLNSGNWRDLIPFRPTYQRVAQSIRDQREKYSQLAAEYRQGEIRTQVDGILGENSPTLRTTRAKLCVKTAIAAADATTPLP